MKITPEHWFVSATATGVANRPSSQILATSTACEVGKAAGLG